MYSTLGTVRTIHLPHAMPCQPVSSRLVKPPRQSQPGMWILPERAPSFEKASNGVQAGELARSGGLRYAGCAIDGAGLVFGGRGRIARGT